MERKGIQPDKPLDKLLPEIIEKARLKSEGGNVSILGKAVCTGNKGLLYKINSVIKFRIL